MLLHIEHFTNGKRPAVPVRSGGRPATTRPPTRTPSRSLTTVARPSGHRNHGYVDLKREPHRVDEIPELNFASSFGA
jgi:hypothetical protein